MALSHELGKKVVAEGVETDEDVGFLRSINCEYAQGFFYGEPMSERDVMQLLRVVRKAERRMKKGLFRRHKMPEMPAMQAATAEAEAAPEGSDAAGRRGPARRSLPTAAPCPQCRARGPGRP